MQPNVVDLWQYRSNSLSLKYHCKDIGIEIFEFFAPCRTKTLMTEFYSLPFLILGYRRRRRRGRRGRRRWGGSDNFKNWWKLREVIYPREAYCTANTKTSRNIIRVSKTFDFVHLPIRHLFICPLLFFVLYLFVLYFSLFFTHLSVTYFCPLLLFVL